MTWSQPPRFAFPAQSARCNSVTEEGRLKPLVVGNHGASGGHFRGMCPLSRSGRWSLEPLQRWSSVHSAASAYACVRLSSADLVDLVVPVPVVLFGSGYVIFDDLGECYVNLPGKTAMPLCFLTAPVRTPHVALAAPCFSRNQPLGTAK